MVLRAETKSVRAGQSAGDRQSLSAGIKAEARRVGFDLVGIAPAVTPTGFSEFRQWLERGFAGEMEYIPRREAAYEHPKHVLESVRSVVMLAINYRTEEPQPSSTTGTGTFCAKHPSGRSGKRCLSPFSSPDAGAGEGIVSRYAWGEVDYHDLLRGKLRRLADFLHNERPGCRTRGTVDTAPLLERDFARLAGLGWFGKNTMLINKRAGSWLFLAALLTDLELDYDEPHESSHCGTCTRCLDACPTDAFPEPHVLDATKCISYLTIELRDAPVPTDLREGMGQWLFGCDVCQDVCPWNHKAPISPEPAFQPVPDLNPADAIALLRMSDEEFRQRFRGTPLERPRRAGLLRNAAIVLGNGGDRRVVPALVEALDDHEPLIRGAAAWALGRLGGDEATAALQSRLDVEDNADVLAEIHAAQRVVVRADGGTRIAD